MNRSVKSFITGIIILLASAALSASMNFNFFNGKSANFIMDSVFRSMRKGITPPFNELEIRNKKLLGKNYDGTLSFSNEATARAATIILMNNKLLIEPDGKNVTIKGDLGYTLKYFLGDIQRMYYNRGDILEARYSMPVKESMYIVSQILNRLSLDLKHKMQPEPRLLVDDIINKALIPTYNMYGTDPLEITSGIIILTSGTFFILIFSLLWDVGFISILRNLDQDGFYNQFRHDFSSSGLKGKVSKNSSKKSSAKVTKNKTQAEIKSAENSKSSSTKSQNPVKSESGKAVQKKNPDSQKKKIPKKQSKERQDKKLTTPGADKEKNTKSATRRKQAEQLSEKEVKRRPAAKIANKEKSAAKSPRNGIKAEQKKSSGQPTVKRKVLKKSGPQLKDKAGTSQNSSEKVNISQQKKQISEKRKSERKKNERT